MMTTMNRRIAAGLRQTRRHLLGGMAGGIGTAALAALVHRDSAAGGPATQAEPLAARAGHFPVGPSG